MRRLALFGLCAVSLTGCAFPFWDRPPFFTGSDPYAPRGDTENMRRVRGQPTAVETITSAGGNMWPGPIPKTPSMADLVKQEGQGQLPPLQAQQSQPPSPTIPPRNSAAPPPTVQPAQPNIPPVPEAAGPPAPRAPSGAETSQVVQTPQGPGVTTGGTGAFKTLTMPNGQTGIVVPNGNGTSTIIMSNGQVQTVPTPK
jgi:hypothetical protein